MLNEGQQKALKAILSWYKGSKRTMILEGKGGTGKTFLLDELAKQLNCSILFLAPTHEALSNLREKVKSKGIFKTCHAALGVQPTLSEKEIAFKHRKLPDVWNNIDLAIIDEISMLDHWMLDLFDSTDVKLLYVGHSSQLPPPSVGRGILDPCISPAFNRGYDVVTLTEPMRNKGELWEFLLSLEESIYSGKEFLKTPYDVSQRDLETYLASEQGIHELKEGSTKLVLWTNGGVSSYNERVRDILWGTQAKKHKYVKGDRIILTTPLTILSDERLFSGRGLKKAYRMNNESLYTNTKGIVVEDSSNCVVELEGLLKVNCTRFTFKTPEGVYTTLEPVSQEEFLKVASHYERLAWACSTQIAKKQAYMYRHFVMSCFARLHYYYAATAHRLQGSTIENIIYLDKDVRQNPNKIERAKCRYVGCSRTEKILRYIQN